jgi:hypothetical protein
MKTLKFMLVVLALIVGLRVLAGYHSAESDRREPAAGTIAIDVQDDPALAERDFGSDGDDALEEAADLPVPIVPGTRVSEARIETPDASGSRPQSRPLARVPSDAAATVRSISGLLSATVERARDDARVQLERSVSTWLAPEVPTNWKPPAHLITRMVRKIDVVPIVKDYATVYEATLQADFSSPNRAAILAAHQHEVVARRLVVLGGGLGFALVCLASLAGYIRADEATRGYYTHWLRAIASAGVGAAGVVLYQLLT